MQTKRKHKRDYLWAHTKVTSKEKVKIPKWFFLILPIATVFEVPSGCEWGERTSNLLQTVQRSQWGAHACSQPKIKEWRLMMVDEQFPLQRKILKGQVNVRNEETRICGRSENTDNRVCFRLRFILYVYCAADEFVYFLTRSKTGIKCRVKDGQIEFRATLFLLFSCY